MPRLPERVDGRRLRAVGVLLAGGRSRRMGVDKAALRLHHGRTLADVVDGALAGTCDEVLVAGPAAILPHRPHVLDAVADSGPLAGIEAGLRVCGDRHLVVAPCDMPLLTAELLSRLLATTDAMITIFEDESGEPARGPRCLPMRIAPAARTVVADALMRRELAVKRLLDRLSVERVPLPATDAAKLVNVNTPQEFAAITTPS